MDLYRSIYVSLSNYIYINDVYTCIHIVLMLTASYPGSHDGRWQATHAPHHGARIGIVFLAAKRLSIIK